MQIFWARSVHYVIVCYFMTQLMYNSNNFYILEMVAAETPEEMERQRLRMLGRVELVKQEYRLMLYGRDVSARLLCDSARHRRFAGLS
jgi:hypothetical protein